MSYTIEPNTVSSPVFPVYFRNNRTSTADVQNVICTLYADSEAIGTWRKSWGSSGFGYDFDIDTRSFIERSIAPFKDAKTSFFGALNSKGFISNTDAFVPYYLYTELEVRNSSGFLETVLGSGETSSTLYAVNAVLPLSDPFMSDYYQPSAGGDFKFLNDGAIAQDISTNEAYFLSYLQKGTNAANFIFYSSTGTEIRNVVVDAGNDEDDEGMLTIKCGMAQMLGTGSWSILSGTLPTSFNSVAYYTVSVGLWEVGAYTRKSEIRRFNKVESCSWNRRVYWFGRLGGCEQYTFKGRIEQKQKDTGQIIQFAPTWNIDFATPVNSYSRGIAKTDTTSQISLDITEPLTTDTATWLRYIRRSPEVYILDEANNYIPVTVEPGEALIDLTRTGQFELKLSLILSNENAQEL